MSGDEVGKLLWEPRCLWSCWAPLSQGGDTGELLIPKLLRSRNELNGTCAFSEFSRGPRPVRLLVQGHVVQTRRLRKTFWSRLLSVPWARHGSLVIWKGWVATGSGHSCPLVQLSFYNDYQCPCYQPRPPKRWWHKAPLPTAHHPQHRGRLERPLVLPLAGPQHRAAWGALRLGLHLRTSQQPFSESSGKRGQASGFWVPLGWAPWESWELTVLPCGHTKGQEPGWRWPKALGREGQDRTGFLHRIIGCLGARLQTAESSQALLGWRQGPAGDSDPARLVR